MKSKLCCLLQTEYRCIGCDIPICSVCAGPDDIIGKHKLPKCPATYYVEWLYDNCGHALNNPDSLESDREYEMQEKEKANGPKQKSK